MPFDAPLTLSLSAPELSCWYSSRDPKQRTQAIKGKAQWSNPDIAFTWKGKPKVKNLNQCRSQICWHESWVLFNNIMSVKIYIATELLFSFPSPRKVNQRFLGHLWSMESQGFVCACTYL